MDAADPWAPDDPLGEALHFLRMSGVFYSRCELTSPWGMTLPPLPGYLCSMSSLPAAAGSRAKEPTPNRFSRASSP